MQSKYKKLVSNTAIFALGSLGSRLISFFLVPLYTNVLSRDQYGIADLIITSANMIVPIISLVIQDSVLRFILSKQANKNEVVKCSFIVMAFGIIVGLAITPLLGLYPAFTEWKYYLSIICISNMIYNVMLAYTKAIEKNKLYSIVSIINTIVLCVCNILFLTVLKFEISGYLISNIVAHFVSIVLLILFTGVLKGVFSAKYNKELMKQMLKYSIPLIANNISWWILNSSDRMMVEYYCSAAQLGLYTAAAKIPALLSVITTIFSQAWSVSAIKEYDGQKDKSFFTNVFKAFSLIMFLACSIVVMISKPFMSVYVSNEFFESWQFVPLLVVGAVYYSFSSFFGSIYGALKKNISVGYTTVIAALINIFINLFFLKRIGVFAAVISTAISYFAVGIYRMLHSRKFFSFKIDFLKFVFNSIIICVQAIFVSLDMYIYLVSIVSIVLLILVNLRDIKQSIQIVKTIISKR